MQPFYRCIHCGNGYYDRTSMINHVDSQQHQLANRQTCYVGRYCCPLCFNRFDLEDDINRHIEFGHITADITKYIELFTDEEYNNRLAQLALRYVIYLYSFPNLVINH